MQSIIKATVVAFAGLALLPALARAQGQTPPAAQPTPAPATGVGTELRLPPVVVSATRSERTLADQPMSVTVVTKEQIEQIPAQSLDDVLRTTVGINVPLAASYQIHPTANSFSMRGLGGIRGLVMLDGVPINDPFFGYIQWNRVPMENIERVEVVRGGGSSLWGNYAMGGVVNIITRKPGAKTEVGVSGGGGSYGTYRGDGFADLVLSEAVKVRANFNGWGTQGFNQVQPAYGPIWVPTTFNALNGQVALYIDPDPSLTANFKVNVFSNNQRLTTPLQTNNQQTYDITGGLTKKFDWGADLTLTAFHEQSRFSTNNTATPFGTATGFGEFVQNVHTTPVWSTGASAQLSGRLNDVVRLATIGVDFQQISGSDSAAIYNGFNSQVVRTDIGSGNQRFIGVFGQLDIFPVETLEILMSARFQNFYNFGGFDGNPGGLGNVPNSSTNSFDPRISALWMVTPNVGVRTAAYTSFRAPNLANLYRGFSVPFGTFLPNAALVPEKLWGVEGGFDVTYGPFSGQFTAYYQEITNLITNRTLTPAQLPPGFFFGTQQVNAGRAVVQGIELQAGWQIMPGLKLDANYTTVSSKIVENQYDPLSIGNQQAGIPTQQAAASLSYSDPRGWRAAARFRWIGQSWGDNANLQPLNSFTVFDLSAGYRFKGVEAFVDIQNLFNQYYIADNSGFNPPLQGTPFTVFAGLKARF
jgi:outer membrane receptor protein involved in Fe transport